MNKKALLFGILKIAFILIAISIIVLIVMFLNNHKEAFVIKNNNQSSNMPLTQSEIEEMSEKYVCPKEYQLLFNKKTKTFYCDHFIKSGINDTIKPYLKK